MRVKSFLLTLTVYSLFFGQQARIQAEEPSQPKIHTCSLGASSFKGQYSTDKKIVFDKRPVREFEFMATGTGTTGVVVRFPSEMVVKINHADSFDKANHLRSLGVLHIDMLGLFGNYEDYKMVHDLEKSLIETHINTPKGLVKVEIRAHVKKDFIRIDVFDQRKDSSSQINVWFESDLSTQEKYIDSALVRYYENPVTDSNDVPWPTNSGRTFGTAIKVLADDSPVNWQEGLIDYDSPKAKKHTIFIAAVSSKNKKGFDETIENKIKNSFTIPYDQFIATHEKWWSDYWQKSYFIPDQNDGKFVKHQAAFDIYRYYVACSSSAERLWPVRFQNDLFRYNNKRNSWTELMISGALEQYQTLYGAMRTGNKEALLNLFNYFIKHYDKLKETSSQPDKGFTIPYALRVPIPLGSSNDPSPGQFWVMLLMCDYTDIWQDKDFAENTLKPLASGCLKFLDNHYKKNENGKMIMFPSGCGETWSNVTNSADLISSLRALLPKLINIAKRYEWHGEQKYWQEIYKSIPELPRGTLDYVWGLKDEAPKIIPSNRFAPASDMSKVESRVYGWTYGHAIYASNHQMTELYSIFPAKLVLLDPCDLQAAKDTYLNRYFAHGKLKDGWQPQLAQAACLGMQDDVLEWFDKYFDWTYTLPNGLARECAASYPGEPMIPLYPSMQGMGTGVIPIFEMLMRDYPDELVLLPCWPKDVGVKFQFYSPYAGKVNVVYEPSKGIGVSTEREIKITSPFNIMDN